MPPPFLSNIQLLRALAAAFVTLLHTQGAIELYSASPEESDFQVFKILGWYGVDLFFVISGFIMMYIAGSQAGKARASLQFLKARFIRIVPLYWLVTSAALLSLLLFPGIFHWLTLDWWHVMSSYLFLPARNSIGLIQPLVPVGWTLSYEMYFYIIFGACLLLPSYRLLLAVLTFYFGISAAWRLVMPPTGIYAQFLTDPMLLEFVFGLWIGASVRAALLPAPRLCIALITLSLLWLLLATYIPSLRSLNRLWLWGLPSMALVLAFVALEKKRIFIAPSWCVALGNSSYALYLTHYFTLAVLGRLWKWLGLGAFIGPNIFALIMFAACIACAHAIHCRIERPLLKRMRQQLLSPTTTVPPPHF